jgi:hypothetical protein
MVNVIEKGTDLIKCKSENGKCKKEKGARSKR